MNVLLFCITLLIAVSVIRGWSRGLIGLVFGLISWLIIAAAVLFGSPVVYSYLMQNTSLYESLYEKVEAGADQYIPTDEESIRRIAEETSLSEDMDAIRKLTDTLGLQDAGENIEDLTQNASKELSKTAVQARKEAVSSISGLIADRILHVVAGLFCYLAASIVCVIVRILINFVTAVGPIGFLMRVAGAVAGAAEGYLYSMIILLVISQIRFTETGMKLYEQVASSPILTMMYETNPLLTLFESIF